MKPIRMPRSDLTTSVAHDGRLTDATGSLRARLFRLAYRLLWNRADAEDAVQNALLKAHAREHQLREASKRWPWLCRMVVRQCHSLGRKTTRRNRHERRFMEDASAPREVSPSDESTSFPLMAALLNELPRRQREVLVLRHLQELSFEEIASLLGMAPETARVHAQRGREKLLRLMKERFPALVETEQPNRHEFREGSIVENES